MPGNLQVRALLSLDLLCTSLWGQQASDPTRPGLSVDLAPAGSEMLVLGSYQAIAINRDIVHDVKVDEEPKDSTGFIASIKK